MDLTLRADRLQSFLTHTYSRTCKHKLRVLKGSIIRLQGLLLDRLTMAYLHLARNQTGSLAGSVTITEVVRDVAILSLDFLN